MKLKVKALLSGLATYVPGYDYMRATGGTGSARYCYSVWLRHLVLAHAHGVTRRVPTSVAELGPGDSIGIGLAALLSGTDRYYALDVVPYSNLASNLSILDELVTLFRRRAAIPGEDEFPYLNPRLESYDFPHDLIGRDKLDAALHADRLADIRSAVKRTRSNEKSRIVYAAPWADPGVIRDQSVDMIYSQAVLEHVDDLQGVYFAMRRWLKPMGFMTHQIDFRSHGKADTWNGHWTYTDLAWKIVVGRRPYLLNRAPYSAHLRELHDAGFEVVAEKVVKSDSGVKRPQLAPSFRDLSDADLTTSGAFVLAVRRSPDGGTPL